MAMAQRLQLATFGWKAALAMATLGPWCRAVGSQTPAPEQQAGALQSAGLG